MEMRPMEPDDLVEVKRLHEQCFPVRYDMVSVSRWRLSIGGPDVHFCTPPLALYTQVAVVPPPTDGCCGWSGSDSHAEERPMDGDSPGQSETGEQSRRYPPHGGDVSGCGGAAEQSSATGQGCGGTEREGRATPGSICPLADAGGGSDDSLDEGGADGGRERQGNIVGLITCQVMPLSRCRDQDRLGLNTSYGGRGGAAHSEVVYILTLGTETSYRRQGIGRALLRRCVWLSRQEKSIGAVYLHVITTNPAAHRFYESEGFAQVCCIDDYYRINGELYDCYLYALFVNGAQPPGEWGWGIQSLSR
ncbi:unnamed protein product [Ectocarpus sp. 12 AP-2014]